MAIYATCAICGGHIISYVDEWQDVFVDGKPIRKKVDIWLHDIYDYEQEPDHPAAPKTNSYPNMTL